MTASLLPLSVVAFCVVVRCRLSVVALRYLPIFICCLWYVLAGIPRQMEPGIRPNRFTSAPSSSISKQLQTFFVCSEIISAGPDGEAHPADSGLEAHTRLLERLLKAPKIPFPGD